jgi:hypothetical protein
MKPERMASAALLLLLSSCIFAQQLSVYAASNYTASVLLGRITGNFEITSSERSEQDNNRGMDNSSPPRNLDGFPATSSSHFPSQATVLHLSDGGACVSLFAGMSSGGRELKIKAKHKGESKGRQFYFRGIKVDKFPAPVLLYIFLTPQCSNLGFAVGVNWPEVAKHLRFAFYWKVDSGDTEVGTLAEIKPSRTEEKQSVWKEGNSSREMEFEIPSHGIPITSVLLVKVFSSEHLLTSVNLRL